MDRTIKTTALLIMGLFFLAAVGLAVAQEDEYILSNEAVFGQLRRSAVFFPHQTHVDTLGEERCDACHHALDENTGQLFYDEGQETTCAECHTAKTVKSIPALREAYHRNCTACHRQTLIKKGETPSGPTTCGECHTTQIQDQSSTG